MVSRLAGPPGNWRQRRRLKVTSSKRLRNLHNKERSKMERKEIEWMVMDGRYVVHCLFPKPIVWQGFYVYGSWPALQELQAE